MRILAALVVWAAAAAAVAAPAPQSGLAQANAALQAGEADRALDLLNAELGRNAGSAEAHNLKCRVLYTLQRWDESAASCEQAVRLSGQNSGYHMWLGRLLGERASHAGFVSAYSLAKRSRAEFEQAAKLDPANAEALADLGEFYYSAPGVVGGGTDKAQNLALQLDRLDQARAHELRGHMFDHQKDFTGAEREFKLALSVAQHPAFQWMTLASFYRRRQRWQEMETAIHSGQAAAARDRSAGVALYLGASILRSTRRDPELERKLLESYLAGPSKTEEAPAFVAHLWLAELKAAQGDSAGAETERQAALALAHDFKPALEFKSQGGRH